MVHLKNIITGILSGAVFFMAVQVGVAQEKTQTSSDNVEVKESVEAKALSETVQKLNVEWAQSNDSKNPAKIAVMKEPVLKAESTPLLSDPRWFLVDVSSASNPAAPADDEQVILAMLGSNPTTPCSGDIPTTVCAVRLNVAEVDNIESYDFESGAYTVEDLRNADAEPTIPGGEYKYEEQN